MGIDLIELDGQLAALGEARADAIRLARQYAGDITSLASVDESLNTLGVAVSAPVGFTVRVDLPKAAPKAAARAPDSAPRPPLLTEVPPLPAEPASPPFFAHAPEGALRPAETGRAPRSEEIALPDPMPHEPPKSGELSLDEAAPRSGSFSLASSEINDGLDEDTDADFEAEFAALSAGDGSRVSPRLHSEPAPALQAREPEAEPAAAREIDIEVSAELTPEPAAGDSAPDAFDEEADAVLALFDTPAGSPVTTSAPAAAAVGGLSDELEPSIAPPAGERDPDAEFDALFDEASSPSGAPLSSDPDQDSVDDLLRDLGSPRVPQDLLAATTRAKSSNPGKSVRPASPLPVDDELAEPTDVIDLSTFDAVTGAKPQASDEPADEDFEIEVDDLVEEGDETLTTGRPSMPGRPPPAPPQPGGLEKRPSFLGRLFGGPKDPQGGSGGK